jgi:hypothetical protein
MINFFKKIKDKIFTFLTATAVFLSIVFYFLNKTKSIEDLEKEKDKKEKENLDAEKDISFNSGKISSLNEVKNDIESDSKKDIKKHIESSSEETLDEFFDKRGF